MGRHLGHYIIFPLLAEPQLTLFTQNIIGNLVRCLQSSLSRDHRRVRIPGSRSACFLVEGGRHKVAILQVLGQKAELASSSWHSTKISENWSASEGYRWDILATGYSHFFS